MSPKPFIWKTIFHIEAMAYKPMLPAAFKYKPRGFLALVGCCEKPSLWLCIPCAPHSAGPQPGRLLQQPYIASIEFTSTDKL